MNGDIVFYTSNPKLIKAGELRARLNANGDRVLRYYFDIRHIELDLHRELSAPELSILQNKVDTLMAQWEKKYQSHIKKEDVEVGKDLAENMTVDAELRRERLRGTLRHTLSIDDSVDWSILKDKSSYSRTLHSERPKKQYVETFPPPPVKVTFTQAIFGKRRGIERRYQDALNCHNAEVRRVEARNKERLSSWLKSWEDWNVAQTEAENSFYTGQSNENEKVDALEAAWRNGQPNAVEEHAAIVLEASDHDDIVQKQVDIRYDPESGLLLVEYMLPTPDDLPATKGVRFVASTGELKHTKISEREIKTLYDDLCYQICLRTIHELFEADTHKHLSSIAFNGKTKSIDRATGQQNLATILSVVVKREEFSSINLEQVEPKACFKLLKGVSAASLVGLTPIAPIIQIARSDKRFIDARSVEMNADGATNLAAMDWDDFEHLVRELFEKEFASRGGEVRVTQSSSDGGVDAIAFDPDPISGGKIVIQAKRYTRTVGVAAIRDLYGTTMNEGANKGILVTTADYGPDAHKFASDKPLTLLSGSHLLNLLEKHGIKAKINLEEARKEMGLRS